MLNILPCHYCFVAVKLTQRNRSILNMYVCITLHRNSHFIYQHFLNIFAIRKLQCHTWYQIHLGLFGFFQSGRIEGYPVVVPKRTSHLKLPSASLQHGISSLAYLMFEGSLCTEKYCEYLF